MDHQLQLMALVMVYIEVCARGIVSIYYAKTTDISMHNLAIA